MIYFELIFFIWGEVDVRFHSYACGHLVVAVPFVEETILSPLNGLVFLVENQVAIDVWLYF